MPCAPLEEQAEIERQIQLVFARIDQIASEAKHANRLLDRLDQSILAKAFSGEIIARNLEAKISHQAAAE